MVNDRGSIKWTSMMLPEHVELLKELWKADSKMEKPIVDTQQLEEINYQLSNSYQNNIEITITLFQHSNLQRYTGKVIKVDPINNSFVFQLTEGINRTIHFNQILSINE